MYYKNKKPESTIENYRYTTTVNNPTDKDKKSSSYILYILLALLFLGICIAIYYFYKKSN